ncbi:LysR family transcriptional regulator [Variovorax paradoxus]|nr:LysR family transcriptional regulator [Variovorax paradoxus]
MSVIDVVSLSLLIGVHETGTISSAARQVGLSPSLANRKLAAIEQAMGARLFVRTARRAKSETGFNDDLPF